MKVWAIAVALLACCCAAVPHTLREPDYTNSPVIPIPDLTEQTPALFGAAIAATFVHNKPPPSITLVFNSDGGSVQAGMEMRQIIEELQEQGVQVNCIVDENAKSMAFYLLQSCSTRAMTKRSIMMTHEPGVQTAGNRFDLRKQAAYLDVLAETMAQYECARLKITCEEFKNRIRDTTWWLDWEDALKIGAVDYIISWKRVPRPLDATTILMMNLDVTKLLEE